MSQETPHDSESAHEWKNKCAVRNYDVEYFLRLLVNVEFIVFEKGWNFFEPVITFYFDVFWIL